jgi:hypothetical protein
MYEGAPPPKRLKLDENIWDDGDQQDEFDPFRDLLDAIDEEKTTDVIMAEADDIMAEADDIMAEADDKMAEADDTEEQENLAPSSKEEEESPNKSWKPPRNMFAVARDTSKQRFNLDRPKENVEVRSR